MSKPGFSSAVPRPLFNAKPLHMHHVAGNKILYCGYGKEIQILFILVHFSETLAMFPAVCELYIMEPYFMGLIRKLIYSMSILWRKAKMLMNTSNRNELWAITVTVRSQNMIRPA